MMFKIINNIKQKMFKNPKNKKQKKKERKRKPQ